MFWLRNEKNIFQTHTLIWEPALNISIAEQADLCHTWSQTPKAGFSWRDVERVFQLIFVFEFKPCEQKLFRVMPHKKITYFF